MAIEHAAVQIARKPWGVGDLHPWSSIDIASVVYTCGAMRHNDQIILPYAVSDTFSNFATIKISALMQAMKS